MTKLANTIKTMTLVESGKLEAHPSFLEAGFTEIMEHTNGCGAEGAKFDFVPDTIWGLNIVYACIIHDWDYYYGATRREKRRADIRFLVNLILIILMGSNWAMTILRVKRAIKYYLAVNLKGDKAFWSGKK